MSVALPVVSFAIHPGCVDRPRQRFRAPFPRAAIFAFNPGSRDEHRFGAERAHQLAFAMAVTISLAFAAASAELCGILGDGA